MFAPAVGPFRGLPKRGITPPDGFGGSQFDLLVDGPACPISASRTKKYFASFTERMRKLVDAQKKAHCSDLTPILKDAPNYP